MLHKRKKCLLATRCLPRPQELRAKSGFTLVELAVVVFLLAVIAAVSIPQLLPLLSYSGLEGSARHLSSFGRGVHAYATMMREPVTVRFDLKNQEYYAVRWIVPKTLEEQKLEEEEPDQLALLAQQQEGGFSPEMVAALMSGQTLENAGVAPDGFDAELLDKQLADQFDQLKRSATEQRLKNVKHEGFLDDIGPKLDDVAKLDLEEPVEEEIHEPMLRGVQIPADVELESIFVGGEAMRGPIVEVPLSAIGFESDVVFYLVNEEGDYFSVVWNAAQGTTDVIEGQV